MKEISLDQTKIPCIPKMNYYNPLDLTKYGTRGVCPTQMYETKTRLPEPIQPHVKESNPCKLNEGFYTPHVNYRDKKYSCHNLDKTYKRYGYYDLPCLPSSYKNTNYNDLNRVMLHHFRSHNLI